MRHVQFKLGHMPAAEFYREEYVEDMQNKQGQRSQKEIMKAKQHNIEFKDTQTVKTLKEGPIDFEENLDNLFIMKRIEIQERILWQKEKKEKNSMQNQKPLATTAYTPVLAKLPKQYENGDSDDDQPEKSDGHPSSEHEENGTSSESDSSEDEQPHVGKRSNAHQVTPSLGDELNHAKCIQDLSFFKVNWETGNNEPDKQFLSNLGSMKRDELEMHLE